MNCPKCNGSMESVKNEGITVDRCNACKGIWFDALEAEDLLDAKHGASVDTGSSIKGWRMDRIRDISCPRCGVRMQTVSDTKDPHVKFEVCTKCHGYFMDAGEFRELAHAEATEKATESILGKVKEFAAIFRHGHGHDETLRDGKAQ
jgi:Zn-finger nucleic acid-binding protein